MKETISFRTVKVGRLTWTVREGFAARIGPILENPEAFLQDSTLFFKNSRNVTLAAIPAEGERPALVLRRLNYGKRMLKFRDTFRASRAHRGLHLAAQLEEAAIPTARGLAAACVRHFRWPFKGYLLTEKIEHAGTVSEYLRETSAVSRAFVYALADLLASLHERGFSHRDLKLTNILVTSDLKLSFIDLDGVRHYRQLPLGRAFRDLARMVQDVMPRWAELRKPAWVFVLRYCRKRQLRDARSAAARIMHFAGRKARQRSTLARRTGAKTT